MTAAATALPSGERWARDVVLMLAEVPLYAFLDVAEFITTRKMLLGIKMRAERLASAAPAKKSAPL